MISVCLLHKTDRKPYPCYLTPNNNNHLIILSFDITQLGWYTIWVSVYIFKSPEIYHFFRRNYGANYSIFYFRSLGNERRATPFKKDQSFLHIIKSRWQGDRVYICQRGSSRPNDEQYL